MSNLKFDDIVEVNNTITGCLVREKAEDFAIHLVDAKKSDGRPSGEVALELLLYIASENA